MKSVIKITTEYTLLSSLITFDNLFPQLKKNNISVCGICDSNLNGSLLFYKRCISENIKPLIGLEVPIDKYRIYLYAKNYEGYKELLNISYNIQTEPFSVVELLKVSNNIIIVIPYSSYELVNSLSNQDIYIGCKNEKEIKNVIVLNKKYLYLDDIKILTEEDNIYLNYLSLIKNGLQEGDYIDNQNTSLEKFVSKNYDDNSQEFIDKINISFPENTDYLPKYKIDSDAFVFLKTLCIKGLNKRMHSSVPDEYKNRLDYELNVIKDMGFVDYFLIVYDYVLFAKKSKIAVGPGRGSAAGSLVSYCLGITDIDPIKYDLLFERFLNPKRVTMPDIDIDFEDERRYEVIDYVKEKYSSDNVGLIATYSNLFSKQVLRDVARVLSIPDENLSKLMKYINSDKDLKENYTEEVKEVLNSDTKLKKCYKIALKLYGLKRHSSIHAAGIVISSEKLKNIVPIMKSGNDLIIGLTMDQLEERGLLKMDFLGLKNLGIIKSVVENIKLIDPTFNLDNIPLDDKKTFELFQNADTKGIFQFETQGMRNILPKVKPTCFNDLVASVALFRPGPMDNIDLYIKNKKSPDRIKYPHINLKNILKETYGIIVYQEQIMQILKVMANYDFAEADNIRRAMSKKKEEILISEKEKFISRSIENGYDEKTSSEIYNLILKFANYGFNKAHSVSYALIGYKMAYLKANYPTVYITTNLNIYKKAGVKTREFINEAQKYHMKLYKCDINKSTNDFINKGINILFPFNQITGISPDFSNAICVERESHGEYKDIFDFVCRIPLTFINESNLTKLIKADVFKIFKYNQKTLINNIDTLINFANMSSGMDLTDVKKPYLIIDKEYSAHELRQNEKDSYGFYISNHPCAAFREKIIKSEDIKSSFGKTIDMILLAESIRTFKTKNNLTMASVIGSDETGEVEIIIFNEKIDIINNLHDGDIFHVRGSVGRRFNDYQIIANTIRVKNK